METARNMDQSKYKKTKSPSTKGTSEEYFCGSEVPETPLTPSKLAIQATDTVHEGTLASIAFAVQRA